MGLDMRIVLCKNRNQVREEGFWNICQTGWVEDEENGGWKPSEVVYWRKFWSLYTPLARRLSLENGQWSLPLTKDDIEFMIDIATHNRDYWDSFNSVPALCEILDRYDEITEKGYVLLFEGDY